MEVLYTRLRFKERELFRNNNEKIIRFVFDQIWFFIETFDIAQFSNRDLAEFVTLSAESRGMVIPGKTKLIETIMNYLCEELNISKSFNNRYDLIQEMVVIALTDHSIDGYKYIEPLTLRIVEEFNKGTHTTTMEEVALRIKNYPELRFLPFDVIEDAVNAIYDCITGDDIME